MANQCICGTCVSATSFTIMYHYYYHYCYQLHFCCYFQPYYCLYTSMIVLYYINPATGSDVKVLSDSNSALFKSYSALCQVRERAEQTASLPASLPACCC